MDSPYAKVFVTILALAVVCGLASSPAARADGNLTVTKLPLTSAGTVSGEKFTRPRFDWDAAFQCGAVCTQWMKLEEYCYYDEVIICEWNPTQVRMRATPAHGWTGPTWSGCQPLGDGCHVQSDQAVEVKATFTDVQPPTDVWLTMPPNTDGKLAGGEWAFAAGAQDNWGIQRFELLFGEQVVATSAGSPSTLTVRTNTLPESTTSVAVSVRAVDLQGNVTRSGVTELPVDLKAPVVQISGPGTNPGTADRQPTFNFSIDDAVAASVKCSVDSETSFAPCDSPVAHRLHAAVADGTHTLRVQATDTRGNVRVQPHDFRVDSIPPDTQITAGREDGAKTDETTATFAFASTEPGGGFQCRVDGAAFTSCGSPRATGALAGGEHTFAVRAVDAVGNIDPSAATRTWTIVVDHDHDGFNGEVDCDDSNPAIHPTAPDVPDNGVDEDCDGHDLVLLDRDGDGYNRPQDCDDANAAVHPGAKEVPENDVDEDCDGREIVVLDRDGDGFNRPQDCDDANAAVNPGAKEVPENGRDDDCDGTDGVVLDRDADGYNRPQDCDDANPRLSPGVRDTPGDRVDDDCDGRVEPWPRLRTLVRMPVEWRGRLSLIVGLELTDVQRGTEVTITCSGRRCPFKTKRVTAPRDGKLVLTTVFKRRWLPAGTRIDVTVRRADAIGSWVRYVTRVRAIPTRTERCWAPGAKQPTAC